MQGRKKRSDRPGWGSPIRPSNFPWKSPALGKRWQKLERLILVAESRVRSAPNMRAKAREIISLATMAKVRLAARWADRLQFATTDQGTTLPQLAPVPAELPDC